MAEEKQPVAQKSFWQSISNRFNAAFGMLGMLLLTLPDMLTGILQALGSAQVQAALAIMPEKWRHVVEVTIRVLGATIAVISAINIWVRVALTKGPAAWPQLPSNKEAK